MRRNAPFALQQAGCHGVAENLAAFALDACRGFQLVFVFQLTTNGQHHGRRNIGNRSAAKSINGELQEPLVLVAGAFGFVGLASHPFIGDGFKCGGRRQLRGGLIGLPLRAWVHTSG
jgi:hypothetical protein